MFNSNHQPDATVFQFIILMFIYSSTCSGRFPAHHQELNDCSGSLWFYLRIMVTAVPCSWSGHRQPLALPSYRGDSRAVFVVGLLLQSWAPDDGRENARNMLSCKKKVRIINWKIVASGWWFIWIVRWWCTDLQTLNLSMRSNFF